MWSRPFWQQEIERLWRSRSVIWLAGVRRVGKTTLCQALPDSEYFDCELPRQRRLMEDAEGFLASLDGKRVVLDEIHRLPNPSELLKIAADHYPRLKIIATGSSTLGAASKFRDTLAGRKAELWLTPATSADLTAFGSPSLTHRLERGGLPAFLLAEAPPEREIQEWMDAFWSKDILELFRLERRSSFLRFVELLLVASGGIFEATRFARPCEVSRTTIANYLAVLEATFVAHIVRPYSTGKTAEIVAAPKVYGFDTGFVCHFRGWSPLRTEDLGQLWEHYVLNELHARRQNRQIHYWRDKQGHELDFVLAPRGQPPVAIECKWSAAEFDASALAVFRRKYPEGENFLVAQDVPRVLKRRYRQLEVTVTHLDGLIERLQSA